MKSLDVSSNAIGTRGMIALAEALEWDLALEELNIVGNQATDPSAFVLADILCRPGCRLRTLHYEQKNNFTQQGKDRLLSAFAFRENKERWLGQYLKDIEKRQTVSLNLLEKNVGDYELIAIASHLAKHKPRKIAAVWLDGGERITCRGISAFARDVIAPNVIKVERVYVQNTMIGDSGATAIAKAIQTNASLRILSLISCDITSEGAKALALALRWNRNLVRVNLRGNRIGDSGLRDILDSFLADAAEETRNPSSDRPVQSSLMSLNVSQNGVTDEGLTPFLTSSSLLALEELHLGQNQITDVGALDIARAICVSSRYRGVADRSCRLRWLNLSECRLTSKGIQALRLFLPPSSILESDRQIEEGDLP